MRGFLFGFIISLLITSAYAEDQIHCVQETSEPEVFKLLETVKNDILGTVPRFCRTDEYDQLSEQVDPGEKSLSHFVEQLRDLKIKEKDAFKVEKDNVETILFQTIKLVSLKKMWALSSEEDQYSILLSSECGNLGLNRLPLSPKNSKQSVKRSTDSEKLMKLCGTSELKEIAPFMTKDILAESLLNIKKIFPESFPKITERLCETIASMDDSILKDEGYSKFLIGDKTISSAEEFSLWLQDTFKQAAVVMDYSKLLSERREDLRGALFIVIRDKYQNAILAEQKMSELKPEESLALLSYMGTAYQPINNCLRKSTCNDDQKEQISNINSALKKLKTEDGNNSGDLKILYRGTMLPETIVEQLKKNPKDYVLDKGFMSTSGNINTARAFSSPALNTLAEQLEKLQEALEKSKKESLGELSKGETVSSENVPSVVPAKKSTLFIIKAKSCSGISQISKSSGEDEFLCPPGMKFNVTQKKDGDKNPYGPVDSVYILEEVLP